MFTDLSPRKLSQKNADVSNTEHSDGHITEELQSYSSRKRRKELDENDTLNILEQKTNGSRKKERYNNLQNRERMDCLNVVQSYFSLSSRLEKVNQVLEDECKQLELELKALNLCEENAVEDQDSRYIQTLEQQYSWERKDISSRVVTLQQEHQHESETLRNRIEKLEKEKTNALKRVGELSQKVLQLQSERRIHIGQGNAHFQEELRKTKEETDREESHHCCRINELWLQSMDYSDMKETNANLRQGLRMAKEEVSRKEDKIQELSQIQHLEQRNADLQQDLLQHNHQKDELQKEKEEILIRLDELQQKVVDHSHMEETNAHLQKEIIQYKHQNEELIRANEELLTRLEEHQQKVVDHSHIEETIAHLQKEIIQYKHQNEELRKANEEALARSDELQQKVFQLQNVDHSHKEKTIAGLQKDLIHYQYQIEELRKTKEEALTRLSEVAGAKLTHGNAAITDLSDDNRPTKIAEKFSELYDNAWTDAFEEIEENFDIKEKDIIELMLSILESAYTMSTEIEKEYESSIIRAVTTLPTMGHVYREQDTYVIPTDVPLTKSLCDIRTSLGAPCAFLIQKMFLSRLPDLLHQELNKDKPGSTVDLNTIPKTVHYAKSCASLSWLMRIREPPVYIHFDFQSGKPYDEILYRHYTQSGALMDYVVWPPLYLHEHGPLLGKGVAQPL